ncbi:similar to Saccharomyces cerevisiae YNL224C SQS1 Stimulates the ATPase and helicase activities of Prp43p [Maudiozyma saulgeensis]|uniref:Protein SQS1 n=1 Tax=Maudiozyma saulgeensis TaxID=1789683 RepID=A0A1X7R278_9SACH|nr:similar to Saccharomyces cerevisiae YNL224C SQS1 Stimulates the ATPase and helicase activities of Prp43p [Kazachstania saulgeensis]
MAKRHKHYAGAKKKRSNGSGGSRGKVNHKSKYLRKRQQSEQKDRKGDGINNWFNSSLPMGNGDLSLGMDYSNPGRAVISAQNIEDYYFGRRKDKSMKQGGFRLGKRNYSSNDLNSANSSFRKRPMVFVKAAEVYDPSHDLILQLAKNQKRKCLPTESLSNDEPDSTDNSDGQYSDFESSDESDSVSDVSSRFEEDIIKQDENTGDESLDVELKEAEDDKIIEVNQTERTYSENEVDKIANVADNELFFVDDTGYSDDNKPIIRNVHVPLKETATPQSKKVPALEFDPSLVIGKVEIPLEEGENGEVIADLTHAPYRNYIKNVLKDINAETDTDNDEDVGYDSGDIIDEIPDVNEDIHDYDTTPISFFASPADSDVQLSERIKTLELEKHLEGNVKEEPQEPEFGFVEDDYVVNTSDIYVTNIRLGFNENSYFLKCYRLFGDHEARWVSQDIFVDFILEDLGLPETRLAAYLRHVKDSLIPKEETPEPIYSDIPFSDSSDEEGAMNNVNNEDDDITLMEGMDEGLDDLVNYALKYSKERNQEFDTKTPVMTGKGKKKKLLVDESLSLDTETIFSLQSKLSSRLGRKADKRRTKEDFINEENKRSNDLLKKYPYGLHIQNMKDEFEEFYSNNKDRLIFPPLDPHGNKTLMKFAKHYYMKTNKAGKGIHTHMMIEKTKKTRRAIPNYGLIAQLLKQRPVFMRIDVKRVQEDFVKTERVKMKSKFHVIEGEIVGENAPEIGQDNIGRRMLEKLGWSSGEGLGTMSNKGISEPLFARVKKGKAGLRLSDDKK